MKRELTKNPDRALGNAEPVVNRELAPLRELVASHRSIYLRREKRTNRMKKKKKRSVNRRDESLDGARQNGRENARNLARPVFYFIAFSPLFVFIAISLRQLVIAFLMPIP